MDAQQQNGEALKRLEQGQNKSDSRYRSRRDKALKNISVSSEILDNPLDALMKQERHELVNAALKQLSPYESWILSEHVCNDRTFRELASERNTTEINIKSTLQCARRKLTAVLAKWGLRYE